jgi:ABC-type proline/glycine betaine transport system ATPase subunit
MSDENKNMDTQQETANIFSAGSIDQLGTLRTILLQPTVDYVESEFDKLRKHNNQQHNDIDSNIEATKVQLLQTINSLEERLTALINRNYEELFDEVNRLQEEKTDRKVLGKLLVEIGNKISL